MTTDNDRRVDSISGEINPGADIRPDEVEFNNAMDLFRRHAQKRFPTGRDVLCVLRSLGYRKVAAAVPVPAYQEGGPRSSKSA